MVFLKESQKTLRIYNQYPKLNANYVVETMKLINAPRESRFSQLGMNTTRPDIRDRFPKGKSRNID